MIIKQNNLRTVFLLLALIFVSLSIYAADLGPEKTLFTIDKIEIEGVKKVEKEAIFERIQSKDGGQVTNYLLRKDIEKIYEMHYFENVEAHHLKRDGKNILQFIVKEKPIISKIDFVGNDELDSDQLTGQIKSKQYAILDISTIKQDIKALEKFYEEKGYYLAAVDYTVVDSEIKENVEIKFNIHENDKVAVKNVTFLGNKAFEDQQLKELMMTQEENFFSFMSESGNFKEMYFHADIEKLKYFYKTKGYLQVNIGNPEITVSEDKRWVFITIKVTEGPQFSVNNVTFTGETLFTEDEMQEGITLKNGQTYSEESLRQDILKLTEMYQDKGYAFANVLRTLNIVPGENKVDVEFSFEKGSIVHFGTIVVKGNSKTRDKVVRREVQIEEGEIFSGSKLRRSRENVNRLGFFEQESVIFNTIPSKKADDILDVEIQVKERNTGQIGMGAGYSTASGPFIQASIAQNNFMGKGQTLSFSLNLSKDSKTYSVDFSEPYLFDTKWTTGAGFSRTINSESSSYDYKSDGFNLRVGYPIFDYTKLFFTYRLEDVAITNLKDKTLDEDTEAGVTSSVTTSAVHDKRNNSFEPTGGYYLKGSVEFAGVGGDKEWLRSEIDGRYYYNVYGDWVFKTHVFAGKLNELNEEKKIPRFRKYYLGGPKTLRGYNVEEIGPKNTRTAADGTISIFNERGLASFYGAMEIEHPLAREAGLKWALFFDGGNIWKHDIGDNGNYELYWDYGFELRWFSPIGLLRFVFGYPLGNKTNDNGVKFNFDIGQFF